jgi:hypothetical protein
MNGVSGGDLMKLAAVAGLNFTDGWPVGEGGNCFACAQYIQGKLGGVIYRLSPARGARDMGAGLNNGRGPTIGASTNKPTGEDWYDHYAVVSEDGTVRDAFTGPDGMPEAEFLQQWDDIAKYPEDLNSDPMGLEWGPTGPGDE